MRRGETGRTVRLLFCFQHTATPHIYTLSLHDALPIFNRAKKSGMVNITSSVNSRERSGINTTGYIDHAALDRKSGSAGMPRPISYAVFCLKKKNGFTLQSTKHLGAQVVWRTNALAESV